METFTLLPPQENEVRQDLPSSGSGEFTPRDPIQVRKFFPRRVRDQYMVGKFCVSSVRGLKSDSNRGFEIG